MRSELVDRFPSIAGLGNQDHIILASKHGGNPFAQNGVVVHSQDSDGSLNVHQ
jgi:hypothetical protein